MGGFDELSNASMEQIYPWAERSLLMMMRRRRRRMMMRRGMVISDGAVMRMVIFVN